MKRFFEFLRLRWQAKRMSRRALKRVPGTLWAAGVTDEGSLLLLHLPTLTEHQVPLRGNLLLLQRIGALPASEEVVDDHTTA